MKFCSNCGSSVTFRIPEGDNRDRFVCNDNNCGVIHYENPRIIAGCLPTYQDKVLLCKRAIEPRYGLWTIPAGFLENKETIEEGCLRETLEETNAEVKIQSLYAIFNIPQISQIYMLYLAHLGQQQYGSTTESLEVKLFKEQDIPWDQLAFPFVPKILKYIFTDIKNNEFPLRIETIERKK